MSTCVRCGASFSCAMAAGEEAAATTGLIDYVDIDAGVNADANVGKAANIAPASSAPARCWCTYLPAAVPLPSEPGGACWCPSCLAAQIAAAGELRNGVK